MTIHDKIERLETKVEQLKIRREAMSQQFEILNDSDSKEDTIKAIALDSEIESLDDEILEIEARLEDLHDRSRDCYSYGAPRG